MLVLLGFAGVLRAGEAGGPSQPMPAAAPGDKKPELLLSCKPVYPTDYAAGHVEGEVLVDFTVGADGRVTDVHAVQSADPRLAPFAEAAVRRWIFLPGVKDGRRVATRMRVPVIFKGDAKEAAAPIDPAREALAAQEAAGRAALGRKDTKAALDAFNAVIRLAPDAAAGYLGRAQAYAAAGRDDEALDDYAQAASIDPADKAALEAFRKGLADTPERTWASLRYETFAEVWRTVYETYFDPTFGGVDWIAVREKYRLMLASAADKPALVELLQRMLGELQRTHFSIVPREAAVFNPAERTRIGTVGVEAAFVEGGVVVTEVRPGSAGEKGGLRPGDLVTRVDGVSLEETLATLGKAGLSPTRAALYVTEFVESRLSAAVGTVVKLEVAGPAGDAPRRTVSVTCATNDAAWSEPIGYFPSTPIRCETRRDPDGIAVMRFNIFVPPVMRQIKGLLRELRPGDGLIIDLRGNGGGISVMASGISGRLCRDAFVLGSMHQRQGVADLDVYPQHSVFDGPVAILVDGRSASTSEILAAGLKERKRARLFGELTAGAALPSFFKSLPTGDLFQFAVADIKTPSGALLEGNGVVPDQVVLRTRADLAVGRDPVEDAARAWIEGQRHPKAKETKG